MRKACILDVAQVLLEYGGGTPWFVSTDVIRGDQPKLVCWIGVKQSGAPSSKSPTVRCAGGPSWLMVCHILVFVVGCVRLDVLYFVSEP